MRRGGTPGAFGKGRPRPTAPHNGVKPCKRPSTGSWCNHACPSCDQEMARRAMRNDAQRTRDLGRMMREAPRTSF